MSVLHKTPISSLIAYAMAGSIAGAILPRISFFAGSIHAIGTCILFNKLKSSLETFLLRPLSDREACVVSWLSLSTWAMIAGTSFIYIADDSLFSWFALSILLFVFIRYSQPSLDEIALRIR